MTKGQYASRRSTRLKAEGRCIDCKEELDSSTVRCSVCNAKHKQRSKAWNRGPRKKPVSNEPSFRVERMLSLAGVLA